MSDITYCTVNGVDLKMDIYFPYKVIEDENPLVVYVHGGGWVGGDKKSGAGSLDISELLARRYVIASLNYRLAPEHVFPAQIEDVKCAIRSLRAHAATYRIDRDRVGAWGGSAGGHLVSLLGLADQSAGFDVGQYPEQSSRVQAVVDYFGPSDLTAADFAKQQALMQVFESEEMLERASPVIHISKDDPPFLIIHGDQDKVVPLSQSQELYDRLRFAGVPATLIIVRNAGHGFSPTTGSINPTRAEITKATGDFFDIYLKGAHTSAEQETTATTYPLDFPEHNWETLVILSAVIVVVAVLVIAALKRHGKLQASHILSRE